MAGPKKKSLASLDEQYRTDGLNADIVQIGEASISRNVFQPGAHCALGGARLKENRRAEQSCQAHHTGVALEGKLRVDGRRVGSRHWAQRRLRIPGHDGWVVSDGDLRAIDRSCAHLATRS
jgi:hypothetical protein